MEARFGSKTVVALLGDITEQRVDAVVNAANSSLLGGGGVDGAIHRAAGASILDECRRLAPCPPGSAVITGAGRLAARAILHTVGPIWRGGEQGEAATLRAAYDSCLTLANEHSFQTIAFPSISTGAYGFPVRLACPQAVLAVLEHLSGDTSLVEVRFVLFSEADLQVYVAELQGRLPA